MNKVIREDNKQSFMSKEKKKRRSKKKKNKKYNLFNKQVSSTSKVDKQVVKGM
jgi:hypothetical protein